MRKPLKYISLILYGVLGIITLLVVFILLNGMTTESSFLASDNIEIAALKEIQIKSQSDSLVLHQDSEGKWQLDFGKTCSALRVNAIFKALSKLEIDRPINKSEFESETKNALSFQLVFKAYSLGQKVKFIPLLNQFFTQTSFVILLSKKQDKAWFFDSKTKRSYLINPKAFFNSSQPILSSKANFWRSRVLLNIPYDSIKSVEIWDADNVGESYRITMNNRKVSLERIGNAQKTQAIDSLLIRAQLHAYTRLRAEDFISDSAKYLAEIRRNNPQLASLTIKTCDGKENRLDFYAKPLEKNTKNDFGIKTKYDLNSCYAITNNQVFSIKYLVVDPLFKSLNFFEVKR
jgi:hypothetical protein